MSNKDLRYKKTENGIRTSLLALSAVSSFESLSVSQVMKKAKLNRSTFYLHYQDLSQVLYSIEKDFLSSLLKLIQGSKSKNIPAMLTEVAAFAQENKEVFLCLLKSCPSHFYRRIELVVTPIIASSPLFLTYDYGPGKEYLPYLFIEGGVGVLQHWLATDNNVTPKQLISSFLRFFGYQEN